MCKIETHIARAQAVTPFVPFHAIKFVTVAAGAPMCMAHRSFMPAFTALNVVEEAVIQDVALKKYENAAFGAALALTTPHFCSGDRKRALAWALAYAMWNTRFLMHIGSPMKLALAQNMICLILTACAPASDSVVVWGAVRTSSIALLQTTAMLS